MMHVSAVLCWRMPAARMYKWNVHVSGCAESCYAWHMCWKIVRLVFSTSLTVITYADMPTVMPSFDFHDLNAYYYQPLSG